MKHVTLKAHYEMMGCPLRYNIVRMFGKYKQLCAADIAHRLQVKKAAVYVHINALLANALIVRETPDKTVRRGMRVYYRANSEYFNAIDAEIREMCHELANVNHAGIDKYTLPRRKRRSDYKGFDEEIADGV